MRKATLFTCFVLLFGLSAQAQDMTLEQVLENHYEAFGGTEVLDAVKSVKMQGDMSIDAMGQQMDMKMTQYVMLPNKSRRDMSLMGQNIVMAYDGTNGWSINPMTGNTAPQDITGPELDDLKEGASSIVTQLYKYEDHDWSAELVGMEEVDGADTYKIKLHKMDGDEEKVVYYFLDAEYFIPVMTEMTGPNPMTGAESKLTTYCLLYTSDAADEL